MAKAKKPASGSKSSADAPKDAGTKPATGTPGKAPSAAASSAKPSGAASSAVETAKSATASSVPKTAKPDAAKSAEAPKGAAKPADSKVPDAKVSSPPKTAETPKETKAVETKTAEKPDVPKPAVAQTAKPAPAPATAQEQQSSAFWPLVLGGVIAGGLGFAVSELNVLNTRIDTTEMQEALSAQADRIETLENVEAPSPPEAQNLEVPGLEEMQSGIASLDDMVAALETRLAELENRPAPTGDGSGPAPEYLDELAALQSSVEAQNAEIQRLLENALSVEEATAAAAREAAVQRALTTITAALNTGAGFGPAVEELTGGGIEDVPEVLVENIDGVPTLLSLQTEFPSTARAALASARASGDDQSEGGFGAFLNRQLGARSVAPREGSDPDAVLSRAEAAVREGRIADALTEIETLPAPAQEVMADWLANAQARAAAEAAVQDLSQRLTAN